MKKILLSICSIIIVLSVFGQSKLPMQFTCERNMEKSTLVTWAECGNFTAVDIDGNTHDLQTYLDAGKTVIIDFSCAWCLPCWNLHQSGVFEDILAAYGPSGTDDVVVLWIEVESTNTLAQIQGVTGTTGDSYADNTQGDWTMGGTWPVPIIDSHLPLAQFSELYAGYVPTVFMVCPSGYYKDVTATCYDGAAAVYAELGSCPSVGQVPVAEIDGPTSGFIGNNLVFSNTGVSVDPITEYAWTFEGGTPATSNEASPSVSWSAAGDFAITLVVTNANGPSIQATASVNIMDPGATDDKMVTFEEVIVETTFPTVFAPYNWTTLDVDGGTVWGDFSTYGVTGAANAFSVYSHTLAASDYAPYAGDKCGFVMTNNPNAGNGSVNNDWFISPAFTLGTGSSFSMFARSTLTTWGLEQFKIGVSTTGTAPANFTILGGTRSAAATWAQVNVDLSAYDGQTIYLAINYISDDLFVFMIDNLQLNTTVGIEGQIENNVTVFPNPATDVINVNYANGAQIRIFNMLGEEVLNINNASEYNAIDVSALEAGSYFVRVIKDNNITNEKVLLVK